MSSARAAAAKVILDAAKQSQDPNTSVGEVAKELGVSKETLSSARLVLSFSTPEELEAVTTGKIGISTVAIEIRKRMTPEQKTAHTSRAHARPPNDIELWARFKPTIDILATMPDVKDVFRVVTSNGGRVKYIKDNLETASNWLKEFMDEWNNHQRSKSTEGPSDSGDGSPITGA